jgi:hypothetical protein
VGAMSGGGSTEDETSFVYKYGSLRSGDAHHDIPCLSRWYSRLAAGLSVHGHCASLPCGHLQQCVNLRRPYTQYWTQSPQTADDVQQWPKWQSNRPRSGHHYRKGFLNLPPSHTLFAATSLLHCPCTSQQNSTCILTH